MLVLTRKRDQQIVLDNAAFARAIELIDELRHRLANVSTDDEPLLDVADHFIRQNPPLPAFITVTEIRGDKIRLGTEAPAYIAVHRHEVYAAIQGTESPDP